MFSIKNLDWFEILEKLKTFSTSESARNTIALTMPLSSPEEAKKNPTACAIGP